MEMRIVGFCIPLHLCGNAATHALLDEEIHVAVCQELELGVGVFEKRVLTQPQACVVVGWVQAVVFETCLSEVFKHISEKECVCCEVEVVVVAQRLAFIGFPYFLGMFIVVVRYMLGFLVCCRRLPLVVKKSR